MNPIVDFCESLHREGLPVSAVSVSRITSNRWRVTCSIPKFISGDPGELPRHTVTVDRDNLPEGVNITELSRWPDQSTEIECNEEQIEAMLHEVAQIGQAVDVARFTGDTPDYPHYLTKPDKWRPDSLRRPAR